MSIRNQSAVVGEQQEGRRSVTDLAAAKYSAYNSNNNRSASLRQSNTSEQEAQELLQLRQEATSKKASTSSSDADPVKPARHQHGDKPGAFRTGFRTESSSDSSGSPEQPEDDEHAPAILLEAELVTPAKSPAPENDQELVQAEPLQKERVLCSRRPMVWLILIGILLLVEGVLGGVLGSSLLSKGDETPPKKGLPDKDGPPLKRDQEGGRGLLRIRL